MDGYKGMDRANGNRIKSKLNGRDVDARTPASVGSRESLPKQGKRVEGKDKSMNEENESVNDLFGVSGGSRGGEDVRRLGRMRGDGDQTEPGQNDGKTTEIEPGLGQSDKGDGGNKLAERATGRRTNSGGEETETADRGKQDGGGGKSSAEKVRDLMQQVKEKLEEVHYDKEKTVILEVQGQGQVSALELMRAVRGLCGGIIACRATGAKTYEVTMSHIKGKERLLDGFKINDVAIHGKGLCNDELVVSFLNLPAYITDEEILKKLDGWGVAAASPIRRRMWPGTKIADGTRFLKVKFTETVQSLPYSARFETALGPEYFRVIHDRQTKVCRMCMQPGHILRDCPEFSCHKCGVQGHYARECVVEKREKEQTKCNICYNRMNECICNESEEEEEEEEERESMEEEEGSLEEEESGEEEQGGERGRAKRAAVGMGPEPAKRKAAAVGVMPELARADEAAVGVMPELADTRAGTADAGLALSESLPQRTPRAQQGGQSRAEPPALAKPSRAREVMGDGEFEDMETENDEEALPCGQGGGRKEERKGPGAGGRQGGVPVPPQAGGLESSGNEMDMEAVAKVRTSMSRSRRKGKKKIGE